ncbi:hypothetical protein [Lentibacillus salicampi]|uniref:hypothetical protein n=1 Tax=Lentibacillus salicampi TaxID=175306 RepID=UPI001ADDD138|nr:hypothetical protein [Lentibacillus salicampi]
MISSIKCNGQEISGGRNQPLFISIIETFSHEGAYKNFVRRCPLFRIHFDYKGEQEAEERKNRQKGGVIGRRAKKSAEERRNRQKSGRIGRRGGVIGRRAKESAEERKNRQKSGRIGRRAEESAEERKNRQKSGRIGRRAEESAEERKSRPGCIIKLRKVGFD